MCLNFKELRGIWENYQTLIIIIFLFITLCIKYMGTEPMTINLTTLSQTLNISSIQSRRNTFFHNGGELLSFCPNVPIIETVL